MTSNEAEMIIDDIHVFVDGMHAIINRKIITGSIALSIYNCICDLPTYTGPRQISVAIQRQLCLEDIKHTCQVVEKPIKLLTEFTDYVDNDGIQWTPDTSASDLLEMWHGAEVAMINCLEGFSLFTTNIIDVARQQLFNSRDLRFLQHLISLHRNLIQCMDEVENAISSRHMELLERY